MTVESAKFHIGQLIRHTMFGYRGVVFDIDPEFQASDAWYEEMARSRPSRDQPWYHVLVHAHTHTTYVAERNLAADAGAERVSHPAIDRLFASFENGRYLPAAPVN